MAENSAEKKPQNKKYDNQTLSECIKKLYLDSETADVYFSIESEDGSTERVPAHKSLLAAVSDVFKAMFYGDLKEDGDVKMSDVTAAGIKEFLQFFYHGQVELTEENVVDVMHLGHKYNVIKCEEIFIQFMKDNLTDDNICTTLGLAILYDKNELVKLCEKRIVTDTDAVFKSIGFLECDKRVLEHILKMKLLSCPESEVFKVCMEWVKAKGKQNVVSKELVQEHLGDLIYEIRFKSMTMQQFVILAETYNSVLSTDFRDITNLIVSPFLIFEQIKFNRSRRQVNWNKDAVIECVREPIDGEEFSYKWSNVRHKEKTTFSTNEPLLLGGFVCGKVEFGNKNIVEDFRSELTLEVKIVECNTLGGAETVVLNMKTSLKSKGTEVLLPSPVLVRPGLFYRIYISEFPREDIHYSKELLTEVRIDPDININFHQNVLFQEKVVGLISTLMFNRI